MNMNKALQHLYKAISGNDTSKVNISKLLVDIHYALTGVQSPVKNNWSKIIDSIATNWTGGGGGGGDFTTATMTINNSENSYVTVGQAPTIAMALGVGELSATRVEANPSPMPTKISIILYKGRASFHVNDDVTITSTSGSIQADAGPLGPTGDYTITGDCTITIS